MLIRQLIGIVLTLAIPALAQSQTAGEQASSVETGASTIVFADGGAFALATPKGWVSDHEAGQQFGVCCVFYPKHSSWDDAESVMYPNIVDKKPGQETVQELVDHDTKIFRRNNPGMTFSDATDLPLGRHKKARIRYFYGVNKGSSEAVAYIDEPKSIALIVLSSKSRTGLKGTLPRFRELLQSYSYMDIQIDRKPVASRISTGPSQQP